MLSAIVKTVKTAAPYIKMGAQAFILAMGVLNALAAVATAIIPHLPDGGSKWWAKAKKLESKPMNAVTEAEIFAMEVVASESDVPEGQPIQSN
jgi:hypothetical protein